MPSPRHAVTALVAAALVTTIAVLPAPASAAPVTHMRDFVGTWVSPGADLTEVKITKDGSRTTVQIWGSCGGERCAIGEFTARRYATSVQDGSRGTVALKGVRVPSFATVTYLITLRDGALILQQTYDYTGDRADSYEEFTLMRK
jgi:hypothetical protein